MQSYRNRPLIEASDSPQVIDNALHESVGFWHANMPSHEAQVWEKVAADAWGAIEDGFSIVGDNIFNPDGEAQLYLSNEELELALVAYGCELLDKDTELANDEVVAINGLLKQFDKFRLDRK